MRPETDAGRDAAQALADAALDPPDAAAESHEDGGELCGWPVPVCLGAGCVDFDPEEGTAVQVDGEGVLLLQKGATEGALRHVFESPCFEEGLATLWHSVSLAGSLDGVTLEVRAGDGESDLESAAWQPAVSGEPLPSFGGACPPRLELQVGLHADEGAPAPRVEGISVCYACSSIFC